MVGAKWLCGRSLVDFMAGLALLLLFGTTSALADVTLKFESEPIGGDLSVAGIKASDKMVGEILFRLKPRHLSCEHAVTCRFDADDLVSGYVSLGPNVFDLRTHATKIEFVYARDSGFKITKWELAAGIPVVSPKGERGSLMVRGFRGTVSDKDYDSIQISHSRGYVAPPTAQIVIGGGKWGVSVDQASLAALQSRSGTRSPSTTANASSQLPSRPAGLDALQSQLAQQFSKVLSEQAQTINGQGLRNGSTSGSAEGTPGDSSQRRQRELSTSPALRDERADPRVPAQTRPNQLKPVDIAAPQTQAEAEPELAALRALLADPVLRERSRARLESQLGIRAVDIWFRVAEWAAGGDKVISADEAGTFAKQSLDFHMALREKEYDNRYPMGVNTPIPQNILHTRRVVPKPVHLNRWLHNYCLGDQLGRETAEFADVLGFSITQDALQRGVRVACESVVIALTPKPAPATPVSEPNVALQFLTSIQLSTSVEAVLPQGVRVSEPDAALFGEYSGVDATGRQRKASVGRSGSDLVISEVWKVDPAGGEVKRTHRSPPLAGLGPNKIHHLKGIATLEPAQVQRQYCVAVLFNLGSRKRLDVSCDLGERRDSIIYYAD